MTGSRLGGSPRRPAAGPEHSRPRTSSTVLDSEGCPLAATIRVPAGPPPYPAIVFTGPLTSVRDQVVGGYAEALSRRGVLTLAFDHRNFGESGGLPRQHEDPQGKLADLRAAVTAVQRRRDVHPDRIALGGISIGGGYALRAAASDPRVAAVVTVAGAFNSPARHFRQLGPRRYRELLGQFLPAEPAAGAEPRYLPVVTSGSGPAMVAGDEQHAYFTGRGRSRHWVNRITLASAYHLMTFDALSAVDLITTPLLVIHGRQDDYCSPELAREVYDRAPGPKRLVWLDTASHVDVYDHPALVSAAAEEIAAFLTAQPTPGAVTGAGAGAVAGTGAGAQAPAATPDATVPAARWPG
jgi:uncharacterized protein